jgi:hypothetical protein
MELTDLLRKAHIDPTQVLVLRHSPSKEPEITKMLPWWAAERPELFNAYQQTQTEKPEKAFQKRKYILSCIGHQPGKSLFVGLYAINGWEVLTSEAYWQIPEHQELKTFGMRGLESGRASCLRFDLTLDKTFYPTWKGKLVLEWPRGRGWWRNAHTQNSFPIQAILEESILIRAMPRWNEIMLSWKELSSLPVSWRAALSRWRGVYYLFDMLSGKGYVGSAYGDTNLLGRWLCYAKSGHGDNKLLRQCDPHYFRFSILELVSPNMPKEEVVQLEANWKQRLHTSAPQGLNEN